MGMESFNDAPKTETGPSESEKRKIMQRIDELKNEEKLQPP